MPLYWLEVKPFSDIEKPVRLRNPLDESINRGIFHGYPPVCWPKSTVLATSFRGLCPMSGILAYFCSARFLDVVFFRPDESWLLEINGLSNPG
jgi:hypothetical protein